MQEVLVSNRKAQRLSVGSKGQRFVVASRGYDAFHYRSDVGGSGGEGGSVGHWLSIHIKQPFPRDEDISICSDFDVLCGTCGHGSRVSTGSAATPPPPPRAKYGFREGVGGGGVSGAGWEGGPFENT